MVSPSSVKKSNLSHRLWQHSFLHFRNFAKLNRLSPVWCSRLRPTTGVHLANCHDQFRGPRSDYVRQSKNKKNRTMRKLVMPSLEDTYLKPKEESSLDEDQTRPGGSHFSYVLI
ncbi:hypothetical protein TNCV_4490231 [Trichonephila clavipes]|nr:hypothetical protein TNCV_4490231 [Trichonephila clavipes]